MAQTTRPDVSFGLFLYVAMGWSRFAGIFRQSSRSPVVVEGGTDQGLVVVVWVAIRGDGVALLVLVVGSLKIKISSKKEEKNKEHTWAQETHRRHVSWAFFSCRPSWRRS